MYCVLSRINVSLMQLGVTLVAAFNEQVIIRCIQAAKHFTSLDNVNMRSFRCSIYHAWNKDYKKSILQKKWCFLCRTCSANLRKQTQKLNSQLSVGVQWEPYTGSEQYDRNPIENFGGTPNTYLIRLMRNSSPVKAGERSVSPRQIDLSLWRGHALWQVDKQRGGSGDVLAQVTHDVFEFTWKVNSPTGNCRNLRRIFGTFSKSLIDTWMALGHKCQTLVVLIHIFKWKEKPISIAFRSVEEPQADVCLVLTLLSYRTVLHEFETI